MKILLLGKNGQVGWELQRALQPLGQVIALDRNINEQGDCGDVSNFEQINQTIARTQPNIVINATAYTSVDKAESEQLQNDLINHLAVKNLAEQCKDINALLVHYSTDYVFDGTGDAPWQEDNSTAPVNSYGQAKRDGEIALEKTGVKFLNFRTSWVYASRGKNFIKTMLMLAKSKEQLTIINDQVGTPTSASLIADVTAQALRYYLLANDAEKIQLLGHYHLVPTGVTTWYEYAQFIFDLTKKQGETLMIKEVLPTTTDNYPTPAKRPLNSRLNNRKIQTNFQLHLPEWQQGVEQTVIELLEKA
ncbi:dTDP-4-dehydrorhamnose reductase [Moraxella osloensis]|uniref:dTDP-4-dehydrorhamnose reductase n=1 Tax=Faucicola osloensis TaxID=34062 RepID=A0A378Q990_FAUOS|nr:dTDP-4-dehydrorhamnose reductase [Moraxella osloensis]AME00686.1 dTDP-4-dehydrorhamnose reductase [Moraxella osloensis]OBX54929.1 dTDP-4-dehydrorhamnose reductase [Moraxella osloensis]QPT41722.1 dTDP-4-dehydrorhamnose reductase [Moraxella osloensis]STY97299.1 dTDP-4-dehydrorhamnose reductase [Moraxella osloensis]